MNRKVVRIRSFRDGRSPPGTTAEIEKPPLSGDPRPMSLDGAEAIGLFAAEINHSMAVLGEQLSRLQAALAERNELLSEIGRGKERQGH